MHIIKHAPLVGGLVVILSLSSFGLSAGPDDFGLWYQANNPQEFKAINKINIGGVDQHQDDMILDVVKSVINRVLGILALIALILALYGGFLMVTSAGDEEQYKKGWKILKSALIGIALIGVAWFIISLIFRLSQQIGRSAEWTSAWTDE